MTSSPSDKRVIVAGSGGHSRSVVSLLKNCGYAVTGIYDVSYVPGMTETVCGVSIIGRLEDIPGDVPLILAVGDNRKRGELFERHRGSVVSDAIIHPSSLIENNVSLGEANLLMAKSCLNYGVSLGNNNILNTGCIIEHECVIGNNNHLAVGAILCGRATVGDYCMIGAGSVIIDTVTLCGGVTVGAGSTVTRDITEPGTYAGSPARKIT